MVSLSVEIPNVDESMLSGEPVPVLKMENEQVFAGTINQKGSFRFKSDKSWQGNHVGKYY